MSAIFILDLKGKVLISRDYRGDLKPGCVERFMPIVMDMEDEGNGSPIVTADGTSFMYIKSNNVYVVAASRRNANAALTFVFLHKLVCIFREYFSELEEESIRDNFVIIYELLDEVMDFGFPQFTETKVLQEFITQEGRKLEIQARPPTTLTNAVSWRSEGIKHKKNEVFLDVVESVNVLVSANGTVLHSDIVGSVQMRVYLTGMPEVRGTIPRLGPFRVLLPPRSAHAPRP